MKSHPSFANFSLGILAITLSLTILTTSLWFTYAILHTMYTDIYRLLEWSVRYSVMRNINETYALSGLFTALMLYITVSILGIKRFFGKLSNRLFKKVEEKVFEEAKD